MKNPVLQTIESRGYWRINFEPLVYAEKLKSVSECLDIVENNVVELRGWDYPHYPRRTGDDTGLIAGKNYYEGWINWFNHIEMWRMYKSGQFLHYVALRDDWMELSGWGVTPNPEPEEQKVLNIIGEATYELTEIFEFLSRLAQNGLYDEGARVSISLHNSKGRTLVIRGALRVPLMGEYKAAQDVIDIVNEYTKEEMVTNSKELALKVILELFERFSWRHPPVETIKKDQENILSGHA